MAVYSKAPKVKRLVTYFRATTGERVPAQITGIVAGNTVNLKTADGVQRNSVARQTSRTTFNTWEYIRRRA